MTKRFSNCPPLDFALSVERERMIGAIAEMKEASSQGTLVARPLINGTKFISDRVESVKNPSRFQEEIGTVHYATSSHTQQALQSAAEARSSWRSVSSEARGELAREVGRVLKAHRYQLAALLVLEIGKPWAEADADVIEAIDFCEYYGLLAPTLAEPKKMQDILGEANWMRYEPAGTFAVIAPWNFALAIPCGMTIASLVTGNTTILKPAEQSSLIAAKFVELVLEAGVPPNAISFLPGSGEEIGRQLVESPLVHGIVFTGSKQVGLEIIRSAASFDDSAQHHIKRVIAELGGKNSIIVDEDADSDEAIKGITKSAFGFAGQKCSACSRLIVVDEMYEPIMKRLVEAAADLSCGDAADPASFLGPVIDPESQQRILSLIETHRSQQELAFKGETPSGGAYVPVTIFRDVDLQSPLWTEEIFGPVLACCRVKDFKTALSVANQSAYALTGGVFSRSPKNLALAKQTFEVGNLYLNRSITGAVVGRQPFGGFRLSGVGSKAGGPDYLLQFLIPRTVTENTLRRGFTPELT